MAERSKQAKKSVAFQNNDGKGSHAGPKSDRNTVKEKKKYKKEYYLSTDDGSQLAQDLARLQNAIKEEKSIS